MGQKKSGSLLLGGDRIFWLLSAQFECKNENICYSRVSCGIGRAITMDILWAIAKTIRPRQWLKNIALFAPITFSGLLFNDGLFLIVAQAVVVFTILASGVYIFNDLLDYQADRLHPFKKKRPIASGELPVPMAILTMITGLTVGLYWATKINVFFFWACLTYIVIQAAYTLWLKRIPIIDVITIASGYILRVYAGGLAIGAHMDVWFLLTVVSASLFSTATWLTYALFSFNHPSIIPKGRVLTLMADLPLTLVSAKLMMITTPFVIYGVMLYLLLIYERNEGESPERIVLSDKPILITVMIWGALVIGLIYYVGAN